MKIPYLIVGVLSGCILALIFWPEEMARDFSLEAESKSEDVRRRPSANELLEACREASSPRDIYQSNLALGRLNLRQIQEELELLVHEGSAYELTREAGSLLSHWAERDPEGALDWSWKTLRGSRKWHFAACQILETWIASGDLAAIDFLASAKKVDRGLTKAEADSAQEFPLQLSYDLMRKVPEWVYFYDANTAMAGYQQGIKSPSFSRNLPMFFDRLTTPESVRDSLNVWTSEHAGTWIRYKILEKGRELGMEFPEEDERIRKIEAARTKAPSDSPLHLEILWMISRDDPEKAFEFVISRKPEERRQALITLYDSWASAHPGETPDYNSIPEEARSLWRDLSRFGPMNNFLKVTHDEAVSRRGR